MENRDQWEAGFAHLLNPQTTCCFTGHRVLPKDPTLPPRLELAIREMADQGVIHFCAGGALGFDTLAARTVLALRQELPALTLTLLLPYRGQANKWNKKNIAIYESIKQDADQVIYVSEEYDRYCMLRRNQRLVDSSGQCICFLRKKRGGTAYTVRYAETQGIPIVFL